MSPFFAVIMVALIMSAGLVIDGGQKIAATSRAETAAAGAEPRRRQRRRNAAARRGRPGRGRLRAARNYLAGQPGVRGSVSVSGGIVTVRTSATEPTIFLSMIGIAAVTGIGAAEANIVPTGQTR